MLSLEMPVRDLPPQYLTEWARCRVRTLAAVFAVACIVGLVSAPDSARAQTPDDPASIVVFKLEGSPDNAELRESLTGVIRDQASGNSRYQLVNDNPVALSDVVVILGCSSVSTTCLGKAADHFDADFLIFGTIEKLDERSRVSVRLFDPNAGRYVRSFGRVMSKMSPPYSEFRKEVDSLLKTEEQRQVTTLKVDSNVSGARVELGGELVGKTPMERRGIAPGRYEVKVHKSGYSTWKSVVELEEGARITLRAPLEKREPAAAASKPTQKKEKQAKATPTPGQKSASSQASAAEGGETTTSPSSETGYTPKAGGRPSDPNTSDVSGVSAWGPWVTMGVGGASLIVSAIEFAVMNEASNDLEKWRREHPNNPPGRCIPEQPKECEIIDRGEKAETLHRVFLGVGSAAIAGGALWLLLRGNGNSDKRASRRWNVGVSPTGVSASWTW